MLKFCLEETKNNVLSSTIYRSQVDIIFLIIKQISLSFQEFIHQFELIKSKSKS